MRFQDVNNITKWPHFLAILYIQHKKYVFCLVPSYQVSIIQNALKLCLRLSGDVMKW